jgi:hypothetical protein
MKVINLSKNKVKQYEHGGPEWSDIQTEAIERLAKEGKFLVIRTNPKGAMGPNSVSTNIREGKPTDKPLQFRSFTEDEYVKFRETGQLPNSKGNPARQGHPSGVSSNKSGTGSGSNLTNPKTDDSNVSRDNYPSADSEPTWMYDRPANTSIFSFEGKDALEQFLTVANAQGFVHLETFDAMSTRGLIYVLFARTGTTPSSAIDEEEPWQPAGPVN